MASTTIPTIQKINAGVRGVKGDAWEYKCVGPKYVLKKIYISHSHYAIDYLQFVATDDTCRETILSGKYGGCEPGAGTNFTVVELDVDEHITTVRGYYCYDLNKAKTVLASITFSSSTGATYGPYGSNFADTVGPNRSTYHRHPYPEHYEIDQSVGGSTNKDSTRLHGLPFCFQIGYSFAGFHGTTIDGEIESIGVFINDRVVNLEANSASRPRRGKH